MNWARWQKYFDLLEIVVNVLAAIFRFKYVWTPDPPDEE